MPNARTLRPNVLTRRQILHGVTTRRSSYRRDHMTRAKLIAIRLTCALATLVCAQAVQAQSTEPPPDTAAQPAVEITPFIALGSAGSPRAGGALAFVWTPKVRIELEAAYHPRALLSSSVNLVYSL